MSNKHLQPNQTENPQSPGEEYYETALRPSEAQYSSPADKKKAFELRLHAANPLNHAPSAFKAEAVLMKDVKTNSETEIPCDTARAKQLYERAADTEDTDPLFYLGLLLQEGAEGIEKDEVRAMQLYERAHAMNNLGFLLQHGAEGVQEDGLRAKQLYERAADAGNAKAMCNLGYIFERGAEGVEQDPVRAKKFYERAADAGLTLAMTNLGHLLLRDDAEGVEQDPVRAMQLFERAADAGNALAMYSLGLLLQQGVEGIQQDVVRAKQLYQRAADAGSVRAAMKLSNNLQETGSVAEPNDLRFRDVSIKPATLNLAEKRNDRQFSEGMIVPLYHEGARKLHDEARRQKTSCLGLLVRARYYTVGDENTPRDATKASQCYEEAFRLTRITDEKALARAEYGRFLLELDEQDEQALYKNRTNRLEKAIQLLEESLIIVPFHSALNDLINVYTHSNVLELRNQQRANELKCLERSYPHPYFKDDMVRYLEAGGDSDRRLISVMRDAMVKPRSCLLLILGAPGRGKTATLNSLRGLPFVSKHVPTELAEISQFLIEPGSRSVDEGMLRDLDFRENSFRAIASRLTQEDVAACERNVRSDTSRTDIVADKHRDVLELVRGAATRSGIGCKNSQFLRCWDMGGQSEYEMAHSLFIARTDILMFVVNLKRVWNDDSREEEVNKLCYWMQLAHMTVRDPSKVRVIVVGTHKGEVGCADDTLDLLIRKVRPLLAKNVDDSWVRDTAEKRGCVFMAIENSAVTDDGNGGGLEQLSETLKRYMGDVLGEREEIPLKWLALVDKMRRMQGAKKVLWTSKEVEKLCEYFPGFPMEGHLRNEELIQGLRKMTTLTGVASTVLFELGNSEWVVSLSPERILGMFRLVTSRRSWERCLEQEDLKRLDECGTLYEDTLKSEIWGTKYEETEKQALINLLCKCDLLVILRDCDGHERRSRALYGVPCLLRSAKRFPRNKGENETSVEITTKFRDPLPKGLQGGLMANLSRTVHEGLQHVGMVGTSSALLVLEEGRVIVEYFAAEREITWTCIGQDPLSLVDKCLKQMEEFLRHRAHPVRVRYRTLFRHEHCQGRDDIEVDHSKLRSPDDEVRCKVCRVPTTLSKVCEGLTRNESSSPNEMGNAYSFFSYILGRVSTLKDITFSYFGREAVLRNESRTTNETGDANTFRFVYGDVLSEISSRREGVLSYFGPNVLEEACKGLSRVLHLGNEDEIAEFGKQLQRYDKRAYERDYKNCWEEEVFCFAISYKQLDENDEKRGRFKFSSEQWQNLKMILKEIGKRGVRTCRIWVDQCLWLRDAPQECWAVSGLFPYLLWPVIALGNRRFQSDRTTVTYERMWPFVEEVLGLWSLGVITARVERGGRKEDGCRKWITRNHRQRLKPEESMRLILLNIYHGGTEGLKTGWTEDVRELQAIAKWNVEFGIDKLVVRRDWRQVIASREVPKPFVSILKQMVLQRSEKDEFLLRSCENGEFLDASKRIEQKGEWNGLTEWTSGNLSDVNESKEEKDSLMSTLGKINVTTDIGKFVLLGFEPNENYAVWLLVALGEDTEGFCLDNVEWTKIVHGGSSRVLRRNSQSEVVGWVLAEQLGKTVGGVRVVFSE